MLAKCEFIFESGYYPALLPWLAETFPCSDDNQLTAATLIQHKHQRGKWVCSEHLWQAKR